MGGRWGQQHDHAVCALRERATQEAEMFAPFSVVGGAMAVLFGVVCSSQPNCTRLRIAFANSIYQ
jgi:hypothetical protein